MSVVCRECGGATDNDYVSCALCKREFHLSCVNEDETVWSSVWHCARCLLCPPRAGRSPSTNEDTVRAEGPMAPTPSTSRNAQPERAEFDELNRWANRARSAQGTPLHQEGDAVKDFLSKMEACFEAMMSKVNRANERSAPAPSRYPHPCSTAYDSAYDSHELSRSQLSARQVVARDLPHFSGRLEDWPMFLATYEETSRLCGFSPSENVLRLRQALSGKALRAVQCRLRRAEDLPEALETLREMFGRPEHLIDTLLAQIRNSPPPKEDKLESLVDFAIAVEEICATVRGSDAEHRFDGPVLRELVDRLPWPIKIDWGKHCLSIPSKNLGEFGKFMRTLKHALLHVVPPSSHTAERRPARHVNVHVTSEAEPPPPTWTKTTGHCACGDECNTLAECWAYWQMDVSQRWGHVRRNGLCKSCLKLHRGQCRDQRQCSRHGCVSKHHRSLHDDPTNATRQPSTPGSKPTTSIGNVEMPRSMENARSTLSKSTNLHSAIDAEVLLRYVPVTIYGSGRSIEALACLDEGSSVTLMEHALMEELGVNGSAKPLCLSWTGGQTREERNSSEVSIVISGAGQSGLRHELFSVRTVRSLDLPQQSVEYSKLSERYSHLKSLPVQSYKRTSPRLLIGIDNYRLSRPLKTVEGAPREPVATKTRIGWVIAGVCAHQDGGSKDATLGIHHALLCTCHDLEQRINEAMKGCFVLEGAKMTSVLRSKADEQALKQLAANTKLIEGRYETGLLWRYDDAKLPGNRSMALRRLDCLEKRMSKDAELRKSMNQTIEEYMKKGYVRKLSELETTSDNPRKWYLPIFPVINPNKPGKLRVVWDAAAAVNGTSLNSNLLTGPDLLVPLPTILQRFREYRVAVAADITEMFHQIRIRESDQNSQRFLWRWTNGQVEPDEYVMTRMTFGAACSPSCAQYVKNINAERFAKQFPRAAQCIREEHYVDDLLTSLEQAHEAVKLCRDVEYIHGEGGFRLHNWLSNSDEVRQAVGGTISVQKSLNLEANISTQKVLGMWWDTETDTFRFKLPKRDEVLMQGKTVPTKRQVLSILMSIFDPLGIIAGFLFYLKVLLQDIWRAEVDWDDKIPNELNDKWKEWLDCLPQLDDVSVPRCYRQLVTLDGCTRQLHVFVDAGRDGFTAVAYFRFEQNGIVEVVLVGGKTSVAPLRYSSVPRMELQAATVGTRLATAVAKAHRETITERFFWTDSKDVICWINSDHRRYSTFVAQRVGEITEASRTVEWRWVPTKLNVADEGTKWPKLKNHLSSSSWFSGPPFLREEECCWPRHQTAPETTDEERRETVAFHKPQEPLFDADRFSRWWRLTRAAAFIWRFIHNARNPSSRRSGPLLPTELALAEKAIIIDTQRQAFPEERRVLETQGSPSERKEYISKSSALFQRSPYMDDDGILRVKGRIDACSYAGLDTKRPIILPRTGKITDLIVDHYHRRYKHVNHQTVMNEVRQRFDIPALRTACHRVRSRCAFCKVRSALPYAPPMADLPVARLSPFTRPFTFTGIDFFGPYYVAIGRRTEKRWGVLFTCLTVRAVHIEVAHSLSTSSCILAVRNFIIRRGTPNEIITDRGTNFVGANRELLEAIKAVNMDELIENANIPYTTWSFNPPSAPHFGGAWERLVQSVKRTLSGIQFTNRPTDEIFKNWLIEVEGILNARPLTEVPVDREEDAPLTPNHFLLGSSAGAKPLVAPDDSASALRNSWKTSQRYADQFWRAWVTTYLPTLTKRTKWHQPVTPLAEGDVVIVVDDNLHRGCWPKGRITRAITSQDGEVRRVHVQLASGKTLERPAVKVARLDIGAQ